jgi:hypothetical protein
MVTETEVPGSIPGASSFSEKQRVWNGVQSASWGQLRSYLEGKVAAPVKKTEINFRGNPLRWPRDTLHPQKLELTSPTSGGRSVGIVRSRTKATEYSLVYLINFDHVPWPDFSIPINIYHWPWGMSQSWWATITIITSVLTWGFPAFYCIQNLILNSTEQSSTAGKLWQVKGKAIPVTGHEGP